MWILLTLIWIIVLLILPVEVYDSSFVITVMAGGLLTGFLLYKLIKQYFPDFNSNFLIALVIVGFGILDFQSYKYRRNSLFEKKGKSTTAEIVDRRIRMARSSAIYYIYYKYKVEGTFYTEKDIVNFDVYFNFKLGPTITIDYVDRRPGISRINQRSLIPDPEAHDRFMKLQKEYMKNKSKE